jgi:phenylacetate-coenzyme A ligase PaaK-like adenylate-forming protein
MSAATFYRWFVPHIVAPLGERLEQPLWTTVRRLAELQWSTAADVEARALSRLKALLQHAGRHVPHYHDLFARTGLDPRDITSLTDLGRVPVTTKVELRRGFPEKTTARNLPESRRQRMMTSGSTGLPFEFYWDREANPILAGTSLFWLGWAGTAVWHTRIVIASPSYFYNRITPRRPLRRLAARAILGERTVSLPSDELTTARFRALVEEITTRGPYFIRGYPRSIAGLAAALSEEGTPLASAPRTVITLAETLTAANVDTIRRGLHARAVSSYSAWEVPQIAHSCPDNPETHHVNAERVIVRVVRDDGTDAAHGEAGRVLLTDLTNYVMPFINYAPGDRAVAGAPCACGRGLPTLDRLEGRDSEVIRTPEGREITGGLLGQLLTFVIGIIPYVWEYQMVQTAPDAVTLRIVPTPRFTAAFGATLRRELESFLAPGVAVTLECLDGIPLEPSGKRLIIKSEMGRPEPSPVRSSTGPG